MNWLEKIGDIRKLPLLGLLLVIFFSSLLLVLVNNTSFESVGPNVEITNGYLLFANAVIILFILVSTTIYAAKLLRKLKEQREALANANKELDRLAYGVSHDLRAPINSMMGLVNLAQDEKDLEKTQNYLQMMKMALNKQERFIKEMIILSKENRYVLKKGIVELDYLIEQVINLHKHMPDASGIRFSTDIGVHRVFTDAHRLEIILNNLVSNAIKYHDTTKSNRFIEIKTSSENDKVSIEVVDNGMGIDGKDKFRIFEMYYKSKDREKGTGLGLFIVKEAIEKLGGKIDVKSEKGKGSTFSIILNK